MPKMQRYFAYFSLPRWSRIRPKLELAEEHKPEPKFKVGDTVKTDYGDVGTIEESDRTHKYLFYGVRFNTNDKRWLFESTLQAVPKNPPATNS